MQKEKIQSNIIKFPVVSNKVAGKPLTFQNKTEKAVEVVTSIKNEVYLIESATNLPTLLSAKLFCSLYTLGIVLDSDLLFFRSWYDLVKKTNIGNITDFGRVEHALGNLLKTSMTLEYKNETCKKEEIIKHKFTLIREYFSYKKESRENLESHRRIFVHLSPPYLKVLKNKAIGFTRGDSDVINFLKSPIEFNLYFLLLKLNFSVFRKNEYYKIKLKTLSNFVGIEWFRPSRSIKQLKHAIASINIASLKATVKNKKNYYLYKIAIQEEGFVIIHQDSSTIKKLK